MQEFAIFIIFFFLVILALFVCYWIVKQICGSPRKEMTKKIILAAPAVGLVALSAKRKSMQSSDIAVAAGIVDDGSPAPESEIPGDIEPEEGSSSPSSASSNPIADQPAEHSASGEAYRSADKPSSVDKSSSREQSNFFDTYHSFETKNSQEVFLSTDITGGASTSYEVDMSCSADASHSNDA